MTTPLPELLAAVPALNDPAEPFSFAADGDTVVGSWDIVKATTLYPTELESIDEKYRITITFDPAEGTYDVNEVRTSSEGTVSGGGAGFEKSFFSGRSTSKEFSFSFGGVTKDEEGISAAPLVYSFETSRIKKPLFAFLAQHGWKRKKGFLRGLFSS